ncbi:MAG: hypothetical protein ACLFP8_01460 [Alphaproteobacteria bacterium]
MPNNTAESQLNDDPSSKKSCSFPWRGSCAVRILAYVANIAMIVFAAFIVKESYGDQQLLAMLFFIPPVLSIWALRKQGDREERDLKKRIRKAQLRKNLKSLSEFDV